MTLGRTSLRALASAAVGPLVACSVVFSTTVEGSGERVEEARAVEPFHTIAVAGGFVLEVVVGGEPGVLVAGHENQLPYVESEVRGGILHLEVREGYELDPPASVRVACPRLESLRLAGAGRVDVQGVSGGALELSLAGSWDLRARGEAERVDVELAGSSDVDLYDLPSERARVRIAGSGDVRVHARESLDVQVAGSGDVRYRGEPQVSQRIAGSGVVERAR